MTATECASEPGKRRCEELGGTCVIESDGYYTINTLCVAIGAILLVAFIWPAAQRLQRMSTAISDSEEPSSYQIFRTTWVGLASELDEEGLAVVSN